MSYTLEFAKKSIKEAQKLPTYVWVILKPKILNLVNYPKVENIKKIRGSHSLYRIRSGSYRVVFEIRKKEKKIVIIKIGHRRDVYKFL